MNYIEFRNSMHDLLLFNTDEVLVKHPGFHINRLSEWTKKGYLISLRKGYYLFADVELNHYVHFLIANQLYPPAYVSLETALSYHNLIPEIVYATTSVSTNLPRRFQNDVGIYRYQQVKPAVFFGYQLLPMPHSVRKVKMATPEKALLDFLYLHPDYQTTEDFASLRLNPYVFNKLDVDRIHDLLTLFDQQTLAKRVDTLLNSIAFFA